MQAMQVMGYMMCYSSNNFASFHSLQKGFLSYNPKHGIHEHGLELLKYVVHKNALKNNIGKW
jgi:hypothetical protein